MLTTMTSYQMAIRDLPRSLEVVQSDQLVQRDTEYYLENIGNVNTIEDLVDDDRLFRYVMKAHGLVVRAVVTNPCLVKVQPAMAMIIGATIGVSSHRE